VISLNMAGSVPDAADLVVSDPVQAGVMAVMAVAAPQPDHSGTADTKGFLTVLDPEGVFPQQIGDASAGVDADPVAPFSQPFGTCARSRPSAGAARRRSTGEPAWSITFRS